LDFKLTDFAKLCEQEPIIMGCLVLPAAEEKAYKPVLKEFGSRKGVKFSWATYAACPEFRFVNITMADVSKERALRLLCSHLKISLDEVAAICDSANSVSLLEIAGLAIVMQTSPPELKAVSDQVTSAVEYNGFSQAIQEFIL
jgi:hydroxymethylpyrimidine pyrophosphatase-like HAD family hydrolase